MRIQKIKLHKFKRFTDFTIDLRNTPSKVVALVGPNGCGKSSVFDAIEEKAKDYKGGSGQVEFLSKSQYIGEEAKYNRSEQIKINILNDETLSKTSYYLRTSYRSTSRINTDQIRRLGKIEDDPGRPNSSIDSDSRLQENYERLIGKFHEDVFNKPVTGVEWAENNTKKLNDILKEILDIQVTSLGNPVEGRGKLYFKKGISTGFPYDNLSSGEKEVIDLIVDLIVKLDTFKETVFCIDEPELHLNTSIQRKLLAELEKLIPNSCQLWVATHSVGFVRALVHDIVDCQIIDMGNSDFDSEVFLTPISKTRVNLKNLFSTALDDLAGLIAPETIIYCEGDKTPSHEYTEKGLDANIYNEIFKSEFPNTLFVSSGGGSEPRKYAEVAILVLNKAFIDTQLLFLKDRGGKEKILTED